MNRVILKINNLSNTEAFTSLEALFIKHENLRELKFKIEYQLSKLKSDYVTDDFIIRRVIVNET